MAHRVKFLFFRFLIAPNELLLQCNRGYMIKKRIQLRFKFSYESSFLLCPYLFLSASFFSFSQNVFYGHWENRLLYLDSR